MTHSWKYLPGALALATLAAGCATTPQTAGFNNNPQPTPAAYSTQSVQDVPGRYSDSRIFYVTYAFTVAPDGSVQDVRVLGSESPALMVLASRQALMRSTFEPCMNVEGESCDHRYTYRYVIPMVQIQAHNP